MKGQHRSLLLDGEGYYPLPCPRGGGKLVIGQPGGDFRGDLNYYSDFYATNKHTGGEVMRGQLFKFLRLLLCFSFVIALLYPCAASAERCEQWVAKVVSVQGTVEVKKVGEALWQPVQIKRHLLPG